MPRPRGSGARVRGGRRGVRARAALRRRSGGRPARRPLLPSAQHLPGAVCGGRGGAGAGVPSAGPRLPPTPGHGHEAAGRGPLVPALRPPALTGPRPRHPHRTTDSAPSAPLFVQLVPRLY